MGGAAAPPPPPRRRCCCCWLPPPPHSVKQYLTNYKATGMTGIYKLYKFLTFKDLDGELGDIQVEIANHETRIMMRLVETLLQQVEPFTKLVERILMLDCLLAFSVVSRECGWVQPQLTDEPVIMVDEARHPIYELCTASFVSNPIRSGGQHPFVSLITGPNASGKTVYLKQVGIVAVLAQVGCWVPAARALLRPLDAIIAVTQATPSVTSPLSAFMMDLTRIC
ncbi:unnamed protein product, partial [Meganyctiphanes norvegica]